MAARLAPSVRARRRAPAGRARACATSPGSRRATARCGRRSSPPTPGPVAEVRRRRRRGPGRRRPRCSPAPSRGDTAGRAEAAGVTDLLDRGRAGVAGFPGKHGGQPRNFTVVQVVIADRPGELARLFNAAGAAGVNIEDIRHRALAGPAGRRRRTVGPPGPGGGAAGRDGGGRLAGPPPVQGRCHGSGRGCAKLDLMSDSAKQDAPEANGRGRGRPDRPEAGVKPGRTGAASAEAPTAAGRRRPCEAGPGRNEAEVPRGPGAQEPGARGGPGQAAARTTGKIHGAHGPAASRRNFRRKSGG